jgi:YidC/Oxa1 family membrane protein insertase
MFHAVTASITSDVGDIFHPIFWVFAQVLALFYSFIPNYIIAISLLTVLVMLLTAPLTVKSTKSMMEMQRIQPEFRKLQQKYKGDKEKMNEEVMKLYREHGVSPLGGCLPLLLQMPFFVCLYGVIKGLTNYKVVKGVHVPDPRYLSSSSKMYQDIFKAHGQIKSFGIDLSQTPFAHHGSFGVSLPYWILFFAAIGLQYLQMSRLDKRNAANLQNNPQMQTMQTMQKVTPLIFGVIYIAFPIGVTVYFIVSSFCRIVIQEILFRAGVTAPRPAGEAGARDLPPKKPAKRGLLDRLADAQAAAQEQRRRQMELRDSIDADSRDTSPKPRPSGSGTKPAMPKPSSTQPKPSGTKPSSTQPKPSGTKPSSPRPKPVSRPAAPRTPPANGRSRPGTTSNGASSNGRNGNNAEAGADGEKPKQPPRAKDKRPRKAR